MRDFLINMPWWGWLIILAIIVVLAMAYATFKGILRNHQIRRQLAAQGYCVQDCDKVSGFKKTLLVRRPRITEEFAYKEVGDKLALVFIDSELGEEHVISTVNFNLYVKYADEFLDRMRKDAGFPVTVLSTDKETQTEN